MIPHSSLNSDSPLALQLLIFDNLFYLDSQNRIQINRKTSLLLCFIFPETFINSISLIENQSIYVLFYSSCFENYFRRKNTAAIKRCLQIIDSNIKQDKFVDIRKNFEKTWEPSHSHTHNRSFRQNYIVLGKGHRLYLTQSDIDLIRLGFKRYLNAVINFNYLADGKLVLNKTLGYINQTHNYTNLVSILNSNFLFNSNTYYKNSTFLKSSLFHSKRHYFDTDYKKNSFNSIIIFDEFNLLKNSKTHHNKKAQAYISLIKNNNPKFSNFKMSKTNYANWYCSCEKFSKKSASYFPFNKRICKHLLSIFIYERNKKVLDSRIKFIPIGLETYLALLLESSNLLL
ncbi:uncharacterized protein ASCRUDRAFT_10601 [Ascoidea rubescens DSM 1968]|uniref:SWIM-type domain-containing protein n=1 Tax=Ascoidea rubescens DSM 1968 TaxID=1344418 RepID=A0A1D2V966_9ASCO|nr:hypothetical protein ASCRUDRAFT_10601 [Ascoidea rubescens DSM 1968]ODV57993.1 hypothetical protein ASCRUDRAFT_10601 [Ascoidea rubescens DSM 1968]